MQKPDMVADILQFAQIVRRDHRSKFPVHNLRRKQTLYCLTHYWIKSIKGLIAKQIFRCRAHTDDYQNLFSYLWKKLQFCDFLPDGIVPSVHEKTWFGTEDKSSGKSAPDPLLYNLPENNCHLRYRKTVSLLLHFHTLAYCQSGFPFIWPYNSSHHPKQGAFPGAVTAHKTKHFPHSNIQSCFIDRFDSVKRLTAFFDFYHGFSSL